MLLSKFSSAEKRSLFLRLTCALIWAAELFWIQKSSFEAVPWIRFPLVIELIRLYFDVIFATTLVLLLRRRWLVPLLIFNFVMLLIVGVYVTYFHRPLMLSRVFYEFQEAWSLHPMVYDLLPPVITAVLVIAFVAKVALLFRSGDFLAPRTLRLRLLGVSLLMFLTPLTALQFTHLRLNVNPNGGLGRIVFAYGYTLPWICDSIANRTLDNHTRQAQKILSSTYDRLSPVENPIAVPGHLVLLQLESVGGQAIDSYWDTKPVMPFLLGLKNQSLYFRLMSFHFNGTCDMDFATVTFTEPYPNLVPYRLPGLKYTNSLPAFMKRHGFKTYVFHGNAALFYDRAAVMGQLGFDGMFFKEQLADRGFKSSIIGYRDADVFRCVREILAESNRACIFTITLDTHVPFKQLETQEMEIFPRPETAAQRYLNSLRHLDNCLRDFIGALPEGTTVVMYGDHTASLDSREFKSDVVEGKEYVCCLIYTKGTNLAVHQQTRDLPVATDGSLNLLDIMSYLRHSIEKAGDITSTGTALISRPSSP